MENVVNVLYYKNVHNLQITGLISRADLEGRRTRRAPPLLQDWAPDFVWVPQAKRMH